jgi:hypothetical protein
MSDIRAVGYGLKDQDDDAAYQMLVTDVQRLKQEVRKGSTSGAGSTTVGGPTTTTPTTSSAMTAFFAEIAGSYSYTAGAHTIAPFDSLVLDQTSGFSLASGTWTAPAAAKCIFTTTIIIQNSTVFDDTFGIDVYKNGAYYRAAILSVWQAGFYTTFSGRVGVAAAAGDSFNLYINLPRAASVAILTFSGEIF